MLSSYSLSGGTGEIRLCAVPEKRTLRAGSTDLCYLPIEFVDGDGKLLPTIEQPVEVLADGGVSLIGMGSALYKTDESFLQNRGRALAALKAGSKPGKAAVTINSAGVEPVTIYLEVE